MTTNPSYTCSNCFKKNQFLYILCADKAGHACCYSCHNIIFERWTGKPGNGFSCAICCDEAFSTAGQKTASAATSLKASQVGTADDPVLLDGAKQGFAKKTSGFKHGQPVGLTQDFILRVFLDGNPEGCSKDSFSSLAKKGATVYVWGDHEEDCPEICVGLIHNWDDVLTHYECQRHDFGMIAADKVYAVSGEYETFEITCVKPHALSDSGSDLGMFEDWDGGDEGCSSMAAAPRFG